MNESDGYWAHVTLHYYGQWLQGDLRGWRERDHRRHVEGDYRHPPVPDDQQRRFLNHARRSLKTDPVKLVSEQMAMVGKLWLHEMEFHSLRCIAVAVSCTHIHGLLRMPEGNGKIVLGKVKRGILFGMKERCRWDGPLWASGCYIKRIRDRQHQVSTFEYILRHRGEGAWVWCFREGIGCIG